MKTAFHLAIGVTNLQKARDFYTGVLGAKEGRSDRLWVDFNFFGHQLSCHLIEKASSFIQYNPVDGQSVPIPHFGLIVPFEDFKSLEELLDKTKISFILKPQIRFEGKEGEQKTMFFKDPFGHCIEIKSFIKNPKDKF